MNPQINLPETMPRIKYVAIPKKRKTLHQWRLHLWEFQKTKYAIIALLFVTLCTNAQNVQFWQGEHFEFVFFNDPVASAKEDGILLGAEIQGVFDWGYVRTSVTNFDALEAGYLDWTTGIGLSISLFKYDKIRYYAGVQGGLIKRDGLFGGETYPTVGTEAGLNWYLGNLVVGARVSRNYRSDFEFWEDVVDNYWVNNGYVLVGWSW